MTGNAFLSARDPRLARAGDLAAARASVAGYRPHDAAQMHVQSELLAFIDANPNALHRSCARGHLTTSAIVLDAPRRCALLTFHRKLRRWLQLGGHCDGDGNLAASALREASEESGIVGLAINPQPIDLDIHQIPANPKEPAHLHLDVRFEVLAPAEAVPQMSDESLDLQWFRLDDLHRIDTDQSVVRLFELAMGPRT